MSRSSWSQTCYQELAHEVEAFVVEHLVENLFILLGEGYLGVIIGLDYLGQIPMEHLVLNTKIILI